jgi:hypothetical protein
MYTKLRGLSYSWQPSHLIVPPWSATGQVIVTERGEWGGFGSFTVQWLP